MNARTFLFGVKHIRFWATNRFFFHLFFRSWTYSMSRCSGFRTAVISSQNSHPSNFLFDSPFHFFQKDWSIGRSIPLSAEVNDQQTSFPCYPLNLLASLFPLFFAFHEFQCVSSRTEETGSADGGRLIRRRVEEGGGGFQWEVAYESICVLRAWGFRWGRIDAYVAVQIERRGTGGQADGLMNW